VGATNSTHQVRLYDQRQAVIGDSLNSIQVDYAVGSNASDASNVGTDDIERIGIDRTGGYGIDVNLSDDVSSVGTSNDGQTLRIELGGNYNIQKGDDVIVEYHDVQNPAGTTDIDSDVAVGLNTQSDPYEPAFDRVDYDRDDFDGYLRALDHADSATNATYNLYADPGTADDGQTLNNVTVDMNASVGWEETAFDGDLSAITADDVTAETSQKALNVTNVDAKTESVTFTFSGDYTLTAGELVEVQFHGVTNPDRPGYHYANVTLNDDTQNTSLSYYRIELSSSVTDASVTPADDAPGATTTHNVSATVDPLDDSDGLETVTAVYLNESANLSGATVDSVAIHRTGGSTDTLAENDYTGHVHGGEYGYIHVHVSDPANNTFSQGDEVVLSLSGVTNPSNESTYSVAVGVNRNYWTDSDDSAVATYTIQAETESGGSGGYYGGGSSDDDGDSGGDSGSSAPDTTTTTTPDGTQDGADSDSEGDTERGSADETTTTEPEPTTTEQPTTETTTPASTTTSTSTPGLTVLTALAALAGAVLLFRRD
jgi:PGF-CTERM protein